MTRGDERRTASDEPEREPERVSVPEPFRPIFRVSPVIEMLGPVYSHGSGLDLVVGMRAAQKHCNLRGHVHGGVLATLADIALGTAGLTREHIHHMSRYASSDKRLLQLLQRAIRLLDEE